MIGQEEWELPNQSEFGSMGNYVMWTSFDVGYCLSTTDEARQLIRPTSIIEHPRYFRAEPV